jgi:hypothetical protein
VILKYGYFPFAIYLVFKGAKALTLILFVLLPLPGEIAFVVGFDVDRICMGGRLDNLGYVIRLIMVFQYLVVFYKMRQGT